MGARGNLYVLKYKDIHGQFTRKTLWVLGSNLGKKNKDHSRKEGGLLYIILEQWLLFSRQIPKSHVVDLNGEILRSGRSDEQTELPLGVGVVVDLCQSFTISIEHNSITFHTNADIIDLIRT